MKSHENKRIKSIKKYIYPLVVSSLLIIEQRFLRNDTHNYMHICMRACTQVRSLARTDEARGLLWLMEEEAAQPGGSEETLLERLFSYYGPAHGDNKGKGHLRLAIARLV